VGRIPTAFGGAFTVPWARPMPCDPPKKTNLFCSLPRTKKAQARPATVPGNVESASRCQRAAENPEELRPHFECRAKRHPGLGARLNRVFHLRRHTNAAARGQQKTPPSWSPEAGSVGSCSIRTRCAALHHRSTSEPIPGASLPLRNCSIPSLCSEWGAATMGMSARSADKPMPSATAAFAGAVRGNDVCIAHMFELGPMVRNLFAQ
jgi:hypothetical protein